MVSGGLLILNNTTNEWRPNSSCFVMYNALLCADLFTVDLVSNVGICQMLVNLQEIKEEIL